MESGKSRRGFASMSPEKRRKIASKGGKAAHEMGRAHEFTSEEARAAGSKGGKAVSRNRQHMQEIGRQGGIHRSNAFREAAARSASTPATAPPPEAA